MFKKLQGLLQNWGKRGKRQRSHRRPEGISLVKDHFPDYVGKYDVSDKLPIGRGDILVLKNGREFKVCQKIMKGAVEKTPVTLQWINKPSSVTSPAKVETYFFESLRELNYYVEQEQAHIEEIIQAEESAERTYTIEECHVMALKENERRKQVKKFFEELPRKQEPVRS